MRNSLFLFLILIGHHCHFGEVIRFSGINTVTGESLSLDSVYIGDYGGGQEIMLRGETELDLNWFVPVEEGKGEEKRRFRISPNYPNSFEERTRFRVEIPEKGQLKLTVYNLLGQAAAVYRGEVFPGEYEYEFQGGSLSAGIYFVQAESPKGNRSRIKMVKLGAGGKGRAEVKPLGNRLYNEDRLSRQTGKTYFFIGYALENITFLRDTIVREGELGSLEMEFQFEPDKGNWLRSYEGHYCTGIVPLADGGYTALGYEEPNRLLLYRLDCYGYEKWHKSYEIGLNTAAIYIDRQSDGGYCLIGSMTVERENGKAETDILFMKTDSMGNREYLKSYGRQGDIEDYGDESEHLICYNAIRAGNGNYLLIGRIKHKKVDIEWDLLLMEVTEAGELIWQRSYPREGEEAWDQYLQQGCSAVETYDGEGYLVLYDEHLEGMTERDMLNWDVRVKKVDKTGLEEWDRGYLAKDIDILRWEGKGGGDRDAERGLSIIREYPPGADWGENPGYYVLMDVYMCHPVYDCCGMFGIDEEGNICNEDKPSTELYHWTRQGSYGMGYGGNFALIDKDSMMVCVNGYGGAEIDKLSLRELDYNKTIKQIWRENIYNDIYFDRGWYYWGYTGNSAFHVTADGGCVVSFFLTRGMYDPSEMVVGKYSGNESSYDSPR